MSHPLDKDPEVRLHAYHGFADQSGWNGKAMYVQAVIDPSVRHQQALGEAIHRWNEVVGARFLFVPDRDTVMVMFYEKPSGEWPFSENPTAAGLTYLVPGRPTVYLRSDLKAQYYEWVNFYAHEIGHVFGLADHPKDDINSVMSYQVKGRWLLRPSREDVASIATLHGLTDIRVRPQDLEGIENVKGFWHWDRFGTSGWRYWLRHLRVSTISELVPYETYTVEAMAEGTLGYGRFKLAVVPGMNRWAYL